MANRSVRMKKPPSNAAVKLIFIRVINNSTMEREDFDSLLEMIAEAHRWRPLTSQVQDVIYGKVVRLGESEFSKLAMRFMEQDRGTVAGLLEAIKQERLRKVQAAPAVLMGTYSQMAPEQQDSYVETIQLVKERLADEMAWLDSQGKIPRTTVGGLASVGTMLARDVLTRGRMERAAISECAEADYGEAS